MKTIELSYKHSLMLYKVTLEEEIKEIRNILNDEMHYRSKCDVYKSEHYKNIIMLRKELRIVDNALNDLTQAD